MLVLFQNCGKPTELQFSNYDLTSQSGVQNAAINLLSNKCASCHNSVNAQGNITDITNIEYLTYSRLVVAGEPEISPIISQVATGNMPPGKPLSGNEVDILKKWVTGLLDSPETGGAPPPTATVEPKYSVLAAQVFGPRCATCHAGRTYKLDTYSSVFSTVIAGNADGSLLYQVVTVGKTGGKMPQGGALSAAQIQAIKDWINAGAPNN